MSNDVKYPQVKVRLTGIDGNAFNIIATVGRAIEDKLGVPAMREYRAEALAKLHGASYDDLIQHAMSYVTVR